MTNRKFVERRDYFDDYIGYGLKIGAGRYVASSTGRARLLRIARASARSSTFSGQSSIWERLRQRLRAEPVDPVPGGLIVFGFAWIWAFHLTTSPMSNVR